MPRSENQKLKLLYLARYFLERTDEAHSVSVAELIAYLDRYVSELPETVRASEETYLSRLRQCAECAHFRQATCVLCGCYAQARAAKRNQRCPLPGAPRWTEEPEPTE